MIPVASITINALIAPLSVGAWLWLLLGVSDSGELASRGIASLKYFTVLSNLLSGAASLVYLVVCVSTGAEPPLWLVTFKLVATASVMLTFLTTALLLVPLYGIPGLYKGGNLLLHLILPLLASVDCCAFVGVGEVPFATTLLAMLPVAAYGTFYLHEILVHGAEENGIVYDFYGFLRWGKEGIAVVFAAMLLATWGITLVLRLLG